MGSKLYVAFLWHMHQPIYKDLTTNRYLLPWVRLHGIKSYYDMGKILGEVEGAQATFNFVPSLLEQLIDYDQGRASDVYLEHTVKDPDDMSREEKEFLLANFFHAHEEFMIRPYPRYLELLGRRGDPRRVGEKIDQFSRQDYLDLQVWFNLTWFGQTVKDYDEEVHSLLRKGRGFSVQDKKRVLTKQLEIIRQIIPLYRSLLESGRIEITTSPYYHPILPLLCNTDEARESSPGAPLPRRRFSYPEDARMQLRQGIDYSYNIFKRVPRGIWPSEGAVSDAALDLMAENGVVWTASDEEILAITLRREGRLAGGDRNFLYQPYLWEGPSGSMAVFFRDHTISDLIGFVYHRWFTTDAVGDFLHRLSNLAQERPAGRPYLICIILDGENAWEYYYRQGYDFLTGIYRGLVEHPLLEMTTFSDYLWRFPVSEKINRIFPGSWINADFGTWIGQPAKNQAWDYLADARGALERKFANGTQGVDWNAAGREMLIAEGSDWFWWFGDTHSSALDAEFDQLFRHHLQHVYRTMEEEVPPQLQYPISTPMEECVVPQPKQMISPTIDGRTDDDKEWEAAGTFSFRKGAGAMQRSQYLVERICYGFDQQNLYIRLEGDGCDWLRGDRPELREAFGWEPRIEIEISHHEKYWLRAAAEPDGVRVYLIKSANGEAGHPLSRFSVAEVLEVAVPLENLGLHENDEFRLRVIVGNEKGELERWPSDNYIYVRVSGPSPDPAGRWYA